MSELYKLTLNEGDGLYDAENTWQVFVVAADTERLAWSTVLSYVKKNNGDDDEKAAWKKTSKRATCQLLGPAEPDVLPGVLIAALDLDRE